MLREILEIDEQKCDGCGECIPSCAEGALYVERGKLRMRSEALCDGLGACLGACTRGALRIVRREAAAFDEAAVPHAPAPAARPPEPAACPGSRPRILEPGPAPAPSPAGAPAQPGARPRLSVLAEAPAAAAPAAARDGDSRLGQWPVQLRLLQPGAPFLQGADLLVAADCVPFAYARFHDDFLAGRRVLVGCPKLDDLAGYLAKLTDIFRRAGPRSVTVVKMEVPCCQGIASATERALAQAGAAAALDVVTVSLGGELLPRRSAGPA